MSVTRENVPQPYERVEAVLDRIQYENMRDFGRLRGEIEELKLMVRHIMEMAQHPMYHAHEHHPVQASWPREERTRRQERWAPPIIPRQDYIEYNQQPIFDYKIVIGSLLGKKEKKKKEDGWDK